MEEQSPAFFPSIVEGANPRLKLGDSAEHLNQRTLKPCALIPLAVLPTFLFLEKDQIRQYFVVLNTPVVHFI